MTLEEEIREIIAAKTLDLVMLYGGKASAHVNEPHPTDESMRKLVDRLMIQDGNR